MMTPITYPLSVDYNYLLCLQPLLPSIFHNNILGTSKEGHNGNGQNREAGKGLVGQFAAPPRGGLPSQLSREPYSPQFSPSSQFKLVSGTLSFSEQRVITSVALGDRPAVSREESDMEAKGACMCINTDSYQIKSWGRSFPDQNVSQSSFLLWIKKSSLK